MEQVLIMDHIPDQLGNVVSLLEQAISSGEQQLGHGAATTSSSAPAPVASVPPPPAAVPAPAASPLPSAPPPPVPAVGVGAEVSPARLAEMLASAHGAVSGGNQAQAPIGNPRGGRGVPQPRRRRVVVTAAKLAKVLEKMMLQAGLGQQ